MKWYLNALLLLLILANAGCAAVGDTGKIFHMRRTEYLKSRNSSALIIPPGLSSSKFEPYYEIPSGPTEISTPPATVPPGLAPMPRLAKMKKN